MDPSVKEPSHIIAINAASPAAGGWFGHFALDPSQAFAKRDRQSGSLGAEAAQNEVSA